MPSFMRSLALFGAVISLSSGLMAVPAFAQTSTDTAPTTGLQAPPAASTDALPAAPAAAAPEAPAAPEVAPPTLGTTETPPLASLPNTEAAPAKKAVTTHKGKKKTTRHKKKSSRKHKTTSKKKAASGVSRLRDAQEHLANLGYYKGKLDGMNGPKTKAAVKKFQKEHHLKVDGVVGPKTYDAIIAADKSKAMSSLPMPPVEANIPPIPNPTPVQSTPDFYATHPDFYGYYHPSYENPVQQVQPGTPQTLYSRFAKVELTEDLTAGSTRKYNITLNGLPLVLVDNQPAVIGVSKTFALGDEDVMIFTSFNDGNATCPYAYHLLVLTASTTRPYEIKNCTRGYQAKVSQGTLFITFPESDDGRATGATWRYDHGDLEKL